MGMRLLMLLLLLPCAFGLEMSEVLPDPAGDDNGREFIELVGSENLTGCMVSDSASSDKLVLVKAGGEVILIVEEDGIYNETPNATIYHIGKAIGNGLGNTADSVIVTCDAVLINVSYDVASIGGYESGKSLIYSNGWHAGEVGGTPGVLPVNSPPENETNTTQEIPASDADHVEVLGQSSGGGRYCNTTLAITMSATEGYPGDSVLFTIVSDGYAGFAAESGGEIFLEGDTLTRREYSLSLPDEDVEITAAARQCDSRQRAVRQIKVLERPIEVHPVLAQEANTSVETAALSAPQALELLEEPASEPLVSPPPITANVVYDQDRNVVPWVSAFGIVTLAISAWLFLQMRKEDGP